MLTPVAAKLYVLPGSHPSRTGRLMLEHEGIDYKRVDLIAALHRPLLRAHGFKAPTVPALRIDGRRIQGTRNISRTLDEIDPEPSHSGEGPERSTAARQTSGPRSKAP